MGAPELPGIRRRIYYISKSEIALWPRYNRDANRRTKTSVLLGSFTLVADAKWKYIDILADKSQLTSEAQGEMPSQTQLNKLTAIHPGVGPEATAAACYLNNSDNVFIVEDMKGLFRVVGSDKWMTKTTVTQDNGQGPTGTTSTTINVEATDEVPAPFYVGIIETEDGNIDCSEAYEGTDIVDTGSNTGNDTSNNNNGNPSFVAPVYSNNVTINGTSHSIASGSATITGPLTSLRFTGSNMDTILVCYGNNNEDEANMAASKSSATWNGNIAGPATVRVKHWNGDPELPEVVDWFTINVTAPASSGGNTGSNTGNDTGSNTGSDDAPVLSNTVMINGRSRDVSSGGTITLTNESLTSISVTGQNIVSVKMDYGGAEGATSYLTVASDKTSASWSGNIPVGEHIQVWVSKGVGQGIRLWFQIHLYNDDGDE